MPDPRHNVADLVRDAARRDPARCALIAESSTAGAASLTWSQFDREVDAVAGGLAGLGFDPGERIALRFGNTLEFPISYFATLRAGLVAVPVNPGYTARELGHILADSRARLLLTTRTLPAPAGLEEFPIGVEVGYDLPREERTGDVERPSVGGAEDLAVLMYTSGTTGAPKGAMLAHRALLANLDQCCALEPAPMSATDVVLLALPLFHIYGLNAALGMVARTGATGVLLERFDPAASLAAMSAHHVTNLPGAPPMYLAWLAAGDPTALAGALSGVRLATSGAAPLPSHALAAMRDGYGIAVYEGYGLTETSPVLTSCLGTGRVKAGSIGQAIPGVELRLVDSEDQVDQVDQVDHDSDPDDPFDDPDSSDGTGEIQVRGDNVFLGYWPNASGGPDAEGWFRTGDVAYRDVDGDLHLVDRRRDLILVNGFNVYPREVELVLAGHPEIEEAAVIGVADAKTGEAVRAVVVLSPGAGLSQTDICDYAATRLARFKCPTSVETVDELPHSVTGKISKARLRELGFADLRAKPAL